MQLLLVDDEEELTAPLQRLLSNQGYVVDVAINGQRAWELTQLKSYDLLILDWMMPRMSGVELCRSLRQQGDHTPVLFLSAKDTLDERVIGLDSGADDYLIKPFELKELLARIRALLRRSPVLASALNQPLKFANLELDITNQVLYRDRQAIALSDKECQILAYFMENPHQLLTHEQIQQQIWHEEVSPNTLVAQIKLLRKKIDQEHKASLINTVYGKGYRFG